jgi:hypothetical protein
MGCLGGQELVGHHRAKSKLLVSDSSFLRADATKNGRFAEELPSPRWATFGPWTRPPRSLSKVAPTLPASFVRIYSRNQAARRQNSVSATARGLSLHTAYTVHAQPLTRTVALTGDHAPGTASGVVFAWDMQQAVINNTGNVAFWSMLAGPGIGDTFSSAGIWVESAASLGLIARGQQHAPGMRQECISIASRYQNSCSPTLVLPAARPGSPTQPSTPSMYLFVGERWRKRPRKRPEWPRETPHATYRQHQTKKS